MKWEGRRQSDNIEDRRNQSVGRAGQGGDPFQRTGFRVPTGRGGKGLGLGGILVILVISWALGINPLTLLSGGDVNLGSSGYEQSDSSPRSASGTTANDQMTQFVRTVLAETEDTWNGIFKAAGQNYTDPTLVLFDGRTNSACGMASAATGPFYCPSDRKVYLDTAFFRQLQQQFGASGDFAQAYVIAHEVGHHVQNLTGILPQFNRARQSMSEVEANKMSVRVELQADCFAGIWGRFTDQKGMLERGDLEEALNAAKQIGDDTLQKRSQGYVVPDSFNHGTSAQRMRWFKQGFDSGKVSSCDTFSVSYDRL